MRIAIIIPTLNAGPQFPLLLREIAGQQVTWTRKIIIDSGSQDDTLALARAYQYEIVQVKPDEFNHGRTRQLGIEYVQDSVDLAVFVTQDIRFLAAGAAARLIEVFQENQVGAAYGRQLPHQGASLLAAQTRWFNYPAQSRVKSWEDRLWLGIKTPFLSDSFAAYRLSALQAVGGFPRVIASEDMYVGAKLLQAGYKIAYAAEAVVAHSHEYTLRQEFKRYFDTGVFQAREPWIRKTFGTAEGEGIKLIRSQITCLYRNRQPLAIPSIFLRNAVRLLAYRLGIWEQYLPLELKRICTNQPQFFGKCGEL